MPSLASPIVELGRAVLNCWRKRNLREPQPSRLLDLAYDNVRCRAQREEHRMLAASSEHSRAGERLLYSAIVALGVNRRRKTRKIAPPQGVRVNALSSFRAVPKVPS
jgi:hypothetical protein